MKAESSCNNGETGDSSGDFQSANPDLNFLGWLRHAAGVELATLMSALREPFPLGLPMVPGLGVRSGFTAAFNAVSEANLFEIFRCLST